MNHPSDFESAPDAFPVKLEQFEGPLGQMAVYPVGVHTPATGPLKSPLIVALAILVATASACWARAHAAPTKITTVMTNSARLYMWKSPLSVLEFSVHQSAINESASY